MAKVNRYDLADLYVERSRARYAFKKRNSAGGKHPNCVNYHWNSRSEGAYPSTREDQVDEQDNQ